MTTSKTILATLPAYPTFDGVSAFQVLRRQFGTNLVPLFEDSDELEEVLAQAKEAEDVVLDLRDYSRKEGSRIVKAFNLLKLDLPQDPRLHALIAQLRENNGCVEGKEGGRLKDLPFSVVRLTRDVWNCIDYIQRSKEEILEILTEAVDVALSPNVDLGEEVKIEDIAQELLGKFKIFQNSDHREEHMLSFYGMSRRMIMIGRSDRSIIASVNKWRDLFNAVRQTKPTPKSAHACIVAHEEKDTFKFSGCKAKARLVATSDSRVTSLCWKVDHDWAQLLIVRDTRNQQVAILTAEGCDVTGLAAILEEKESGKWHLEKRYAESGNGGPMLLNGGASRVIGATSLSNDELIRLVQKNVTYTEPAREERRKFVTPSRKPGYTHPVGAADYLLKKKSAPASVSSEPVAPVPVAEEPAVKASEASVVSTPAPSVVKAETIELQPLELKAPAAEATSPTPPKSGNGSAKPTTPPERTSVVMLVEKMTGKPPVIKLESEDPFASLEKNERKAARAARAAMRELNRAFPGGVPMKIMNVILAGGKKASAAATEPAAEETIAN